MKITIPRELIRDPLDSLETRLSIEAAPECNGEECGVWSLDSPHYHLVEVGHEPDAGPRRYAI